VDLTTTEVRVVGCLIEKQRTTPDAYPLSVNALRLACNQTTNRDPVVSYDEEEIRIALARLRTRGWTRLAGAGRASKYRHLIDEKLGLDDGEMALMCVLMLRGEQTPGELKQRTDRLHAFADLDAVGDGLRRLIERGLVVRHERRPGQKEDRYTHTLSEDADEPAAAAAAPAPASAPPPITAPPPVAAPPPAEDDYARLRDEVARLSTEIDALRARLDDLGA
jgi:uncharacterized protein YceH (UPF0502 family)